MAVEIQVPRSDGGNFYVQAWAFFAIDVFFVVLRFLARIQTVGSIRKLELDDWLMKVALVGNRVTHSITSSLTML